MHMSISKGSDNTMDENFDWADEVNEAVDTGILPDCKTSEKTINHLLAKMEEWCQKNKNIATGPNGSQRNTSQTRDTSPEDTSTYYSEEPYASIDNAEFELPSTKEIVPSVIQSSSDPFEDAESFDALLEHLTKTLEAWSFEDSKIITAKNVFTGTIHKKQAQKPEFQTSNPAKKHELTSYSKDDEYDVDNHKISEAQYMDEGITTSTPIAASTSDQMQVPKESEHETAEFDVYEAEEPYIQALERYIKAYPRASFPPHCHFLNLEEEPVQERMPPRPLGVPECKLLRNTDRRVTMANTNMTTCGFSEWMELASKGISIQEITITSAERSLMKDKKLGNYRSKPSGLRRSWTIEYL
ncbi:hypothetical protein HYFRA_00008541 [Hymenoscyphus fraxineus]|uniref:Uncharacterized protein n=1 Tax=Hymenoscyphus fraxineus TaxID=746836 RepID=A0A9N9KZA8_9HELO|nr:hypothetical protein HYFRA_00008541 [Hymenoscyphus fraxineus]